MNCSNTTASATGGIGPPPMVRLQGDIIPSRAAANKSQSQYQCGQRWPLSPWGSPEHNGDPYSDRWSALGWSKMEQPGWPSALGTIKQQWLSS